MCVCVGRGGIPNFFLHYEGGFQKEKCGGGGGDKATY